MAEARRVCQACGELVGLAQFGDDDLNRARWTVVGIDGSPHQPRCRAVKRRKASPTGPTLKGLREVINEDRAFPLGEDKGRLGP